MVVAWGFRQNWPGLQLGPMYIAHTAQFRGISHGQICILLDYLPEGICLETFSLPPSHPGMPHIIQASLFPPRKVISLSQSRDAIPSFRHPFSHQEKSYHYSNPGMPYHSGIPFPIKKSHITIPIQGCHTIQPSLSPPRKVISLSQSRDAIPFRHPFSHQ